MPDATAPARTERLFNGVDRVLSVFEMAMVAAAAASLFLIMVLIFADAMGRYLFNSPLSFVFDLVVLYLMSSALLLILSYTLRHGGHISIDLFANMMPRRVYLVLIGVSLLVAAVVTGIIGWETTHLAHESWAMGEVMTGIHTWQLWISKALVAVGFIGLTLRLVHIGLANLIAGLTGNDALAIAIMHDPTDQEGEL